MMTEQQKIDAFSEATLIHANEGVGFGLDPMHIANILMLAALRIVEDVRGKEEVVAGLRLAAEHIEHG